MFTPVGMFSPRWEITKFTQNNTVMCTKESSQQTLKIPNNNYDVGFEKAYRTTTMNIIWYTLQILIFLQRGLLPSIIKRSAQPSGLRKRNISWNVTWPDTQIEQIWKNMNFDENIYLWLKNIFFTFYSDWYVLQIHNIIQYDNLFWI